MSSRLPYNQEVCQLADYYSCVEVNILKIGNDVKACIFITEQFCMRDTLIESSACLLLSSNYAFHYKAILLKIKH